MTSAYECVARERRQVTSPSTHRSLVILPWPSHACFTDLEDCRHCGLSPGLFKVSEFRWTTGSDSIIRHVCNQEVWTVVVNARQWHATATVISPQWRWNTTLETVQIISSDVNWSLQQRCALLRVRVVVICGHSECISSRIVIVVVIVSHRCDLVLSSSTAENGFRCWPEQTYD